MKAVKRITAWLLLMTKRLYKKPVFLIILAMIPTLTFCYGAVAQQESGMLTVAIAREDDDPLAIKAMEDLAADKNLILFKTCASVEEAEDMVRNYQADAAWIFKAELTKKIDRFAARPSSYRAFIQILERETTVPLMLAREKLSGVVFGDTSRAFYLEYLRDNIKEAKKLSDEELLTHYEAMVASNTLFEFAYLDSDEPVEDVQDANYLLTPVRGLLAVLAVLCGLATAMYYIRDERAGAYAWIPERKKAAVEFGGQMVSVLNVAAVTVLSLWAAGLNVSMGREVAMALLYALCVAVFSMTVRRLLGSLRGVGVLMPMLIVVMLVICPVFFDLGALRELQYLFPATYYIGGAYSDRYLRLMLVYTLVLLAVYFLTGKIFKRK